MVFSDSHCHLDKYRPESLTEVLDQARVKHVDVIVSVGTTLESSTETIHLAQSCEGVLAAVGIHPWNAVPLTDEVRIGLRELARGESVVAIGEIGLDYDRCPETREIQKELLIYQLSLARETGLPVNVHCRGAHQDMMHILRKDIGSDMDGMIHGFSGDRTMLKDWLDLGFYVSIGVRGFVTDETLALPAAVRDIPLSRLLTETDSVATGQPVGPADVSLVAEKLASLRGATVEEIADIATANLKRLLKL